MKNILCYGDSNTWGANPNDGSRYTDDVRWTGILQRELGGGYQVIEEGYNGRTSIWGLLFRPHCITRCTIKQ